jgi:hypothetical protein
MPEYLTRRFVPSILWPDRRLIVAAAAGLLLKIPSELRSTTLNTGNWILGVRYSEVQELLFAYCMLIYALMLLERLRDFHPTSSP